MTQIIFANANIHPPKIDLLHQNTRSMLNGRCPGLTIPLLAQSSLPPSDLPQPLSNVHPLPYPRPISPSLHSWIMQLKLNETRISDANCVNFKHEIF